MSNCIENLSRLGAGILFPAIASALFIPMVSAFDFSTLAIRVTQGVLAGLSLGLFVACGMIWAFITAHGYPYEHMSETTLPDSHTDDSPVEPSSLPSTTAENVG